MFFFHKIGTCDYTLIDKMRNYCPLGAKQYLGTQLISLYVHVLNNSQQLNLVGWSQIGRVGLQYPKMLQNVSVELYTTLKWRNVIVGNKAK
jgi:hypothetical protein